MRVRFRAEAWSDVATAREWYDSKRAGLGDEFVQSLEAVVSRVSEWPGSFPEIAVGLRRALLTRFPYAFYYRHRDDTIEVIACLHLKQSPHRWLDRS
jgi:plasmid stabilization system protein ParE